MSRTKDSKRAVNPLIYSYAIPIMRCFSLICALFRDGPATCSYRHRDPVAIYQIQSDPASKLGLRVGGGKISTI